MRLSLSLINFYHDLRLCGQYELAYSVFHLATLLDIIYSSQEKEVRNDSSRYRRCFRNFRVFLLA